MMSGPLSIQLRQLTTADAGTRVEMAARCAFAICTEGDFTIKILNEYHKVSAGVIVACMPFVNIELIEISTPGKVIFGNIHITDIPKIINHWINTDNLSAIQKCPLVSVDESSLGRLSAMIEDYRNTCEQNLNSNKIPLCQRIEQDLIEFRSKLIVGEVLKIYFANISMKPAGHTRRDDIFQRFILSLYSNFRQHHDVRYYADNSGLSLKYFSTVIRQLSGITPSEWIETVVIGEAKTLLGDMNRSIKEIATILNFPDAPTFTKYFARVTSLPPKAYRRKISSQDT